MEVYQAQIENILVSHHGQWEDLSASEKDQCDVILARWTRVERKMQNLLAKRAAPVK